MILLTASSLRGDVRSELLASLRAYDARSPIQVTANLELQRTTSGRFANNNMTTTIAVAVDHAADGLTLRFDPSTVARAAAEAVARSADPNQPTPTRDALQEVDALSLEDLLDFGSALERMLKIATVVSDAQATFQGKPARLVTFQLTAKLPKQARSVFNVKFSEDRLRLWLAADGTPVGAERTRKGSAGFLFLKGEMRNKDSWYLTRRGDRLLVTRHENSFAGSGFGQKAEGKTVRTLVVR